jgi:hypothetical protein
MELSASSPGSSQAVILARKFDTLRARELVICRYNPPTVTRGELAFRK